MSVGKGSHPNSKKALAKTMWKKGGPVPKGGRPKGSLSLKERMKKFLDLQVFSQMPNGTTEPITVLDSIIVKLLDNAQQGNMFAIKEVLDRNFGKEPEKIEIEEDRELRETVDQLNKSVALIKKYERDY